MTTTADLAEPTIDPGADLLGIVHSLEPVIRQYADEIETNRELPRPLVDALYDSGVFKAFWPREVGGLEVEPVEWLQMVEELARIDGSVGWLAMINCGVAMNYLTPEVFDKLRERTGGRFIASQNFGRWAGKAKRVDGGYVISGRWPFVSGSPNATWVGGASVLYDDDDQVVMHPDGLPWIINGLWEQDKATLWDTWDGLGLRGTGSGDMEVHDLFVPDEQINHLGMHDQTYDRPLFRLKEMVLMAHAAHALGVARSAQEAFLAQVNKKPARGSVRQSSQGQVQAHQIAYAKSDALVRAARALVHTTVQEAYDDVAVHPGQKLDMELRVRLREANIFAVRSAKEAVDLVFAMAGSAAVYRGRPLERAYRDMSTASNHVVIAETEYAAVGSYYLTRDREDGPTIAGRAFL